MRQAIGAGWSPLLDGLAAAQQYSIERRAGEGLSRALQVRAGARDVEVYVSPGGRSVRVWVDGREVPRATS